MRLEFKEVFYLYGSSNHSQPKLAIGHGSRDRVTVDASCHFEYRLPLGSGISDDCRLALLPNPASELILRLIERRHATACWRAASRNTERTDPGTAPSHGVNPHAVRVLGSRSVLPARRGILDNPRSARQAAWPESAGLHIARLYF